MFHSFSLDAQQRAAALHTEGALCVVAGPGSGKTRVIIERMVYLIREKNIPADSILAITFTNKVANELKGRLAFRMTAVGARYPYIGTFHSLAFDILTTHAVAAGIALPLTVISETGQRAVMKEILKDYPHIRLKDAILQLTVLKSRADANYGDALSDIRDIAQKYEKRLFLHSLFDFDDLLTHCCALLRSNPDILKKYQNRFRYIMVDEYQDTNPVQADLISLLAPPENNVCIIGDPHQAIYSFRGAAQKSFLSFRDHYPRTKTVSLETNYRSSPRIVEASNALIEGRSQNTVPSKDFLAPVYIVSAPTPKEEARYIIAAIQKLIGGTDLHYARDGAAASEFFGAHHCTLGDIGVLYRFNAVGDALERHFEESGIPYQRTGSGTLFDYPEVRAIIEELKKCGALSSVSFSDQVRKIIETRKIKEQYRARQYNRLLQLHACAVAYDTYGAIEARERFLKDISLAREEEAYLSQDAVTLMTAHSAKGLEFPVVFIVGAEQGLFPASHRNAGVDSEEEKRLFYVAMTRAKEQLCIIYCGTRTLFGKTRRTQPSQFLKCIPAHCVVRVSIQEKKKSPQGRLF